MSGVASRWVRESEVASSGGNGDVYRVRDSTNEIEGPAAQKVLQPEQFKRYARFQREVRVSKGIRHRSIARVLDDFLPETPSAETPPFYVMPWCDGGTFQGLVKRGDHKGSANHALRAIRPIFEAVAFLHQDEKSHRDIKPSNILREGDGTPVLADFGLCFDLADSDQLTLTPEVVGSLRYRAPEYLTGRLETRDHGPGDVYSLGRVLWALIAGQPPDEGANLNYPGHNLRELFPEQHLTNVQFLISSMTAEARERRPRINEALEELDFILTPQEPVKGGHTGAARAIAAFLETDVELGAHRATQEQAKVDLERIDAALLAGRDVLANNEEIGGLLTKYGDNERARFVIDHPGDLHPGEHALLARQLGWPDIPSTRAISIAFYPGADAQRRRPMLLGMLGCARSKRDLRILAFLYSRANDNAHPTVAYAGKVATSSVDSANLVRTVANLAGWLAPRFLEELSRIWAQP